MSVEQIHVVLERLCALLRAEARAQGAADGLLPVQLEALHYLSQCNRYSDTVQGLSEFLGQTKGTVSQTVKVLESRGLVKKKFDTDDRRVVHLKITPAGRRLIAMLVPAQPLVAALRRSPDGHVESLAETLLALLRSIQQAEQARSFAACRTCRFNELSNKGFRCALTGETLTQPETELICREHEYPPAETA